MSSKKARGFVKVRSDVGSERYIRVSQERGKWLLVLCDDKEAHGYGSYAVTGRDMGESLGLMH